MHQILLIWIYYPSQVLACYKLPTVSSISFHLSSLQAIINLQQSLVKGLLIALPDQQPLGPPNETGLGGSAYLHSLNLNSGSESQALSVPEFEHMPEKQLSHY